MTNGIFVAHPDSGASNHMTSEKTLFDPVSFRTLAKLILVSLGDDSEIFATGKGMICLLFNVNGKKKEGQFEDVLFILKVKVTLLSVGQSVCLPHCKVIFDNNVCEYINKNTNEIIAQAFTSKDSDLYMLDGNTNRAKGGCKPMSSPYQLINVNILHRCLGHLGTDNCWLLVNCGLVDRVDQIVGEEEFCKGCAYRHSKQKHHPSTSTKTKQQLERIHINLCGPLPNSLGGNHYFLVIIDEHTHYHWVKFLPKKSNLFSHLKAWKLQAEQEANLKLQYLKLDGGKEFRSKLFEDWLTVEGVVHKKSAPYKHEQNGLAKRGIQNILQQAICQLFSANMSQGFWPYAVETAVYLINRSTTTTLDNETPFKAWMGKCPSIKHLHTFGEMGYIHIPPETQKKWTKKSCPCQLLRYTERSRKYKLWDLEWCMVVVSPNVDFNELSISCLTLSQNQSLKDLSQVLDTEETTHKRKAQDSKDEEQMGDAANLTSEWESDEEVLQLKVTKDERVPNGISPGVPLIPREPDAPAHRHRCSEVECLADRAGLPPTHERR